MVIESLYVAGQKDMPQLEEEFREVTLQHDTDVLPYKDATIELRRVTYKDVKTTSLYVARELLIAQVGIADVLQRHGLPSQLDLEGGVVLGGVDEQEQSYTQGLTPPIVEIFNGQAYVLDGSHRTNLGRYLGRRSFTAVCIANIRSDCPPYAHPNDWSEVRQYPEVPKDPALRKRYRDKDYYRMYRNFGPLNGSTPRYPDQDTPTN